jgi:hypothetical protein
LDWLLAGFDKRTRRTVVRSPRAVPWERTLPWATLMVLQRAAAVPGRDDRGRGSACAKAVADNTSRGVPTSATARIPNAGGWSAVGRRRGARPGDAWTMSSKISTPRLNVRAVSTPHLRRKHPTNQRLRRRVVTQQQFSCPLLCATGPAAMNRLTSRAATRHATAVGPAGRRCAGYSIGNASGSGAVLSRAAGHASGSTPPHGRDAPNGNTTQPARRRPRRRRQSQLARPRRSALDCLAPQAP